MRDLESIYSSFKWKLLINVTRASLMKKLYKYYGIANLEKHSKMINGIIPQLHLLFVQEEHEKNIGRK